jgi:hypothetical protein
MHDLMHNYEFVCLRKISVLNAKPNPAYVGKPYSMSEIGQQLGIKQFRPRQHFISKFKLKMLLFYILFNLIAEALGLNVSDSLGTTLAILG